MRTQLPPLQRGTAPQFSAHACCVQMAGFIKMPLGTKVDLGPGDIVLDGDPFPLPKRGNSSSHFSAHVLLPNSWIDQYATWYEGKRHPRRHCVRWGLSSPSRSSPPQKKGGHSPQFSAHVCCGEMGGLWPNSRPSQLLLSTCWSKFSSQTFIHFMIIFPLKPWFHVKIKLF